MKFLDSDTKAFPYRSGMKRWWGFIDAGGGSLIDAETSGITIRLSDFNEGLAAMEFYDRTAAMIDTTGKKRFSIYPHSFGWNYTLRNKLLPFRDQSSGRWGYVDKDGYPVIRAQFALGFPFSENRAVVKIGDLNGIIDHQGKWIISPSLTFALGFQEGLAPVQRGGRWLFLDPDGRPAFSRDFEWARAFGDGLAPVRENNLWGAIDRKGRLAVPIRYQDAWASRGGPLMVRSNNLWGFVDSRASPAPQMRGGSSPSRRPAVCIIGTSAAPPEARFTADRLCSRPVCLHGSAVSQSMSSRIAFFIDGHVLFFSIIAISVAATLNWRNSVWGYWINLATVGIADTGFIFFVLVPGHTPAWPSILGPVFWVLATIFSTIALLTRTKGATRTFTGDNI